MTSALNFESRSRMTYRYGPASGNASRSCCTTGGRSGSHVEVQNSAPPVFDDKETIEELKSHCRHGEKVHGNDGLAMIGQKRKPPFIRITPPPNPSEVSCDRTFRYYEAELQQFAVDLRCSPIGVFPCHTADHGPDLLRHSGSTAMRPGSPAPVKAETCAMPADDGLRFHNDQSLLPSRPASSEPDPQNPINAVHCWSWMFPFEHSDLLAQRQYFERSIGAAAEENPASCQQRE
jgi:hypothetical protein